MNEAFRKIKESKDKDAADLFLHKILPMSGALGFPSKLPLIHRSQVPPGVP